MRACQAGRYEYELEAVIEYIFRRNNGLRIDLFLVSESLGDRLQTIGILRDLRKGQKPSDHAPLFAELDAPAA